MNLFKGSIFIFLISLIVCAGCKKPEYIMLPNGKVMEKISYIDNPKYKKNFLTTISGKIEVVDTETKTAKSLDEFLSRLKLSIVTDKGERVFIVSDYKTYKDENILRFTGGRNTTISALYINKKIKYKKEKCKVYAIDKILVLNGVPMYKTSEFKPDFTWNPVSQNPSAAQPQKKQYQSQNQTKKENK